MSDVRPTVPAEGARRTGPRLRGGAGETSDLLAASVRQGNAHSNNITALMLPFLGALGWRGTERELHEALPHFADDIDITDLRNVLATLGYPTRERKVRQLSSVDPRLIPCIAHHADGTLSIILSHDAAGYVLLDEAGNAAEEADITDLKAIYVPVRNAEDAAERPTPRAQNASWIMALVRRFDRSIWRMLLASMVLNFLALMTPLFVMMLYDQVIPVRSVPVWAGLGVGVLIAFVFDMLIRVRRARMIAFIGARIDFSVASTTFSKLLSLPASMTETAPIGDQVAKLRDFDSTRDVFTGLLVTVVLDLPFLLISLAILAAIAGPLALVPLAMMALYGAIWLIISGPLKRSVAAASKAKAARHAFLVETLSNLRTIKEAAVEDIWVDRYRDYSADAAMSQHSTAQIAFLLQTLSQGIMLLSGLVTLAVGVDLAIEGGLSLGVLIAGMAIIWRILSPLQSLFLSMTRVEQIRVAIKQIDALMALKGEADRKRQSAGVVRTWQGGLRFNRVSLRYGQSNEPALLGVGFRIKPHEFLAITGPNGSGKSSILRVLLGLQRPQAGQIFLDGIDIRQIPPAELRHAMAYVPQNSKMFHGTIAQNLRLGNPSASDAELEAACDLAGVLEDIRLLDRGFSTRIGDQSVWQINAGFLQKLALARAYAMNSPILLMDEPAHALDDRGDARLVEALRELHYKKTIVMVSHRPSHIRLADRVILMERGTVAEDGTPDQIYNQGRVVL